MADLGDDEKFQYQLLQLLSRLHDDCDYYLGACVEHGVDLVVAQKHLWGGNIEGHIAKMREIYDDWLSEKPEWLSSEDIDRYEKRMLDARDGMTVNEFNELCGTHEKGISARTPSLSDRCNGAKEASKGLDTSSSKEEQDHGIGSHNTEDR